jgi:hypothetical protein
MTHDVPHPEPSGHEPVSASSRLLMLAAAGLVLLIVLSMAAMWGYQTLLRSRAPWEPTAVQPPTQDPAIRPQLEPYQRRQRIQYEQEQRKLLDEYRWNGDERKTARIPIERAMQLVAKRYGSRKKERVQNGDRR